MTTGPTIGILGFGLPVAPGDPDSSPNSAVLLGLAPVIYKPSRCPSCATSVPGSSAMFKALGLRSPLQS